MLALTVMDVTRSMLFDLVLEGKDAEEFLGVDEAQFAEHAEIQQRIEKQLTQLKSDGTRFMVKVKNYLVRSNKRRLEDE